MGKVFHFTCVRTVRLRRRFLARVLLVGLIAALLPEKVGAQDLLLTPQPAWIAHTTRAGDQEARPWADDRLRLELEVAAARHREMRPGGRGVLIGAAVGAAVAALAVTAVCDAENCASHPDTYKIAALGVGIGAAVGGLIDLALHARRRR